MISSFLPPKSTFVVRIKDGSPGSMVNGCGVATHGGSFFSLMAQEDTADVLLAAMMNPGFVATTSDCVRTKANSVNSIFIDL